MYKLSACTALICAFSLSAAAQVPDSLSFQGCLTNSGGDPVADASYAVTFTLYDHPTADSLIWSEGQSVATVGCVYDTYLGKSTSLEDIAFDRRLWLGINVGGDGEMTPRTPLATAPYAFGLRGLRIIPPSNSSWAPSLIGGHITNSIQSGVSGATISGGGWDNGITPAPNIVNGSGGAIGGGGGNTAGQSATICGGTLNTANFYGSIGGGDQNTAGQEASIGGGARNDASGSHSTIGGGSGNEASDNNATVGGGASNLARERGATVGGGWQNSVKGAYSTICGGRENSVDSLASWATVPGGLENQANESLSFAAGHGAVANHRGTFVWADNSEGFPAVHFQSSADNQFLVRSAGGVGLGTHTPAEQLEVNGAIKIGSNWGTDNGTIRWTGSDFEGRKAGSWVSLTDAATSIWQQNDSDIYYSVGDVGIGTNTPLFNLNIQDPFGSALMVLGGGGYGGPNGVIFDDEVSGAGVQLVWRTVPDQIALERASTGDFESAAFTYDRSGDYFHFNSANTVADTSPDTDPNKHVVHIENTYTGTGGDVLALTINAASPGVNNNFATFYKGGGSTPVGRIEMNSAANGVSYLTGSADYAEALPRLLEEEFIEAGDIVGVTGGFVTRATDRAQRLMVVSDQPSVLGNVPPSSKEDLYESVAFVGQVEVKVRGPVESGDYIIPSGLDDGVGVAISPTAMSAALASQVVGRAWADSSEAGVSRVLIQVGLDRADVLAKLLEKQEQRMMKEEVKLEALTRRVEEIERHLAASAGMIANPKPTDEAAPRYQGGPAD